MNLVTISDAEQIKTRKLLEQILAELNSNNRVRFFVSRGKGESTVQCLRVMLSRVRANLERKGRPRKHFKLHSSVFRYTEMPGVDPTHECVILWRSKQTNHEITETLERLMMGNEE
jgi:hypothetical protein